MNLVKGIWIRDLAIYHPAMVRDNEYFINFYEEKGFFAKFLAEENFGRDKRYIIKTGTGETSVTMATTACKRVLAKLGMSAKDIDVICFCSLTPDYLSPPGALMIHNAIDGKPETFCYDLNANCVGMVYAFDQLSKYMAASTSVKRALLVGAESLSLMFSPLDIVNNICFGDSACAVVVEKTDDQSKFVDTGYYANSKQIKAAKSPLCGMGYLTKAPKDKLFYSLKPVDISCTHSVEKVKEMLAEHNLEVSDLKLICTSQFARTLGENFCIELGATCEQWIYVGDKYGYTGANSPFICLLEAIQANRVHRGDYVLLWTVGASTQYIWSLIRF